jgi:hypothetical protein
MFGKCQDIDFCPIPGARTKATSVRDPIAVRTKIRYVAVHGRVSPVTAKFIMGERKAVRGLVRRKVE